jgi:hypothetical protein
MMFMINGGERVSNRIQVHGRPEVCLVSRMLVELHMSQALRDIVPAVI